MRNEKQTTPTLTIEFRDGTSKELDLGKEVTVLKLPNAREFVEFHQMKSGEWTMVLTDKTLEGKRVKSIVFENLTP